MKLFSNLSLLKSSMIPITTFLDIKPRVLFYNLELFSIFSSSISIRCFLNFLHQVHIFLSVWELILNSLFSIFIIALDWERETLIWCSTYLHICWLLLACTLTRNLTFNLGTLGWHSNRVTWPGLKLTLWD